MRGAGPTITAAVAEDAYLPLKRLSSYAGLSVRTLRSHLRDPMHPLPYYRVGGKVLVRRSDYDTWAAQFRARDTSTLDQTVNRLLEGL
jgi:hypothetical protein